MIFVTIQGVGSGAAFAGCLILAQEEVRCYDWNATKRMEDQQIRIATDNRRRVTIDCELKKLVILCIAATSNNLGYIHGDAVANERRKKREPLFLSNIAVKLLPSEHFIKLVKRGDGR